MNPFLGENIRWRKTTKNKHHRWTGLMTVLCMGAGFIPRATSSDSQQINWDDLVSVDAPRVRVRLLADQRAVRIEGDNVKIAGKWSAPVNNLSFHLVGNKAIWI